MEQHGKIDIGKCVCGYGPHGGIHVQAYWLHEHIVKENKRNYLTGLLTDLSNGAELKPNEIASTIKFLLDDPDESWL